MNLPCRAFAVLLLATGLLSTVTDRAPAADAKADRPDLTTLLEPRTFTDAEGDKLPYRLLKPRNYDPTRKYPLVLFLHGAGERGEDNKAQMIHGVSRFAEADSRQEFPCFVVVPQCPKGKRWVEVDWTLDSHRQPAEPSAPMQQTLGLLGALQKEFSIDARRLYVTGLSMGGFGVWDLISRQPTMFAAAVPVCGGGDEMTANLLVKTPIWAFHGDKDGVVKVSRSQNMIEAIRKAGGKPRYTEYEGVGHNAWVRAYQEPDLLKWLFAQNLPES